MLFSLFMKSFFLGWVLFLIQATGSEPTPVKLIATWPNDPRYYTQILQDHQIDASVSLSDFAEYRPLFQQDQSRWGKILQSLHLDFRKPLPLFEKLVFFNIFDFVHREHNLKRLPKENMILFLWEPPNVLGKMYKPKVTDCFARVYTWNDDLVDGKKFFKFYYPDLRPMIPDVVPFEEKKLCTLVASCIVNKSRSSLYKEREKAISFFEGVGESGFEFYGRGWKGEDHKSYRGPLADKIQAVKQYRFSIAYENTQGLKGYITEKIFDCFAAGNVPVYWGAPNVTDFIPKDCFIDRRDFACMEDLYAFLKGMGKEEYEGYLRRIRLFLESDAAKKFSRQSFEALFAEAIRSFSS